MHTRTLRASLRAGWPVRGARCPPVAGPQRQDVEPVGTPAWRWLTRLVEHLHRLHEVVPGAWLGQIAGVQHVLAICHHGQLAGQRHAGDVGAVHRAVRSKVPAWVEGREGEGGCFICRARFGLAPPSALVRRSRVDVEELDVGVAADEVVHQQRQVLLHHVHHAHGVHHCSAPRPPGQVVRGVAHVCARRGAARSAVLACTHPIHQSLRPGSWWCQGRRC